MDDMIEITGADLRTLVKTAYNLSRPQGMGFRHFTPGPLDDETVDAILKNKDTQSDYSAAIYMDYVRGRVVKLGVFHTSEGRFYISKRWFDHSEADLVELLISIGIPAPARLGA